MPTADVDEWLAARFNKKVEKPPAPVVEVHQDTVQVQVNRSAPAKEVRQLVLGNGDEYLTYIRSTVSEANIDYNTKGILGRPEFVVKCTSKEKVEQAVGLISDLLEMVKEELEKLSKEHEQVPKGKQNWADEDDDEELPMPSSPLSSPSAPAPEVPESPPRDRAPPRSPGGKGGRGGGQSQGGQSRGGQGGGQGGGQQWSGSGQNWNQGGWNQSQGWQGGQGWQSGQRGGQQWSEGDWSEQRPQQPAAKGAEAEKAVEEGEEQSPAVEEPPAAPEPVGPVIDDDGFEMIQKPKKTAAAGPRQPDAGSAGGKGDRRGAGKGDFGKDARQSPKGGKGGKDAGGRDAGGKDGNRGKDGGGGKDGGKGGKGKDGGKDGKGKEPGPPPEPKAFTRANMTSTSSGLSFAEMARKSAEKRGEQ